MCPPWRGCGPRQGGHIGPPLPGNFIVLPGTLDIASRKHDMSSDQEKTATSSADSADANDDGDLNDMLQEMRILLQGAQVLTAFLVILPFNEGFARIDPVEKWIYVATFLCSISGLVIFSAPAAHHRLVRPLVDR